MAIAIGITYGAAKAELASVVANGMEAVTGDPRVMRRTNEAIKLCLDSLIPVGGMAVYDVVADGTELFLPKELENAIEVEVLNEARVNDSGDVTQGWALVSNSAYVDPASAHDNPLVDLFLQVDPDDHTILRRRYDYPGLSPGATVRVTGAKRFIPITQDGDSLIVQNVSALKLAILSLEHLERGPGSIDDAEKYRAMAIKRLEDEVRKHQMDPSNTLKRKARYQEDLTTFDEGSLGRTRARLALELPGFLSRGKSEITYLVNRAVQMLVDNRNQLAISGRIAIHGTTTELVYVPVNVASNPLPWQDYNQIRLMIQSFITEGPDPQELTVAEEYQKKAFELQKAQLIEATEKLRHTQYTAALGTYVVGTFGWTVARLALEMPGGLALTTTELERDASMAEMRIMERGIFKNCLRTLTATVTGGEILFPRDVEAVLGADICGRPIDIRSAFFEFQKNGPGYNFCGCQAMFTDLGEVRFTQTGALRRRYRYNGSAGDNVELEAVCKARWVQKEACDEMTIRNVEAIRLFCQGIQSEKKEDWKNAGVAQADAIDVLEKEMIEYLGGIQHVPNADIDGYGFAGLDHSPL